MMKSTKSLVQIVLLLTLAINVHAANPTNAMSPMPGVPGTNFSEWGAGFTPNSAATLYFTSVRKALNLIVSINQIDKDRVGSFPVLKLRQFFNSGIGLIYQHFREELEAATLALVDNQPT
jgi:hypothetical protein